MSYSRSNKLSRWKHLMKLAAKDTSTVSGVGHNNNSNSFTGMIIYRFFMSSVLHACAMDNIL